MKRKPKRKLSKRRDPELMFSYALENPLCELFGHIEGSSWDKKLREYKRALGRTPYIEDFTPEVHHIFGGTTHRWDILSNIICVSRPAHEWIHLMEREYSTVAAIWVKMVKDEFDRDLMRQTLGFDPIGRIEGYDLREEWVENLRLDIFERLSAYG